MESQNQAEFKPEQLPGVTRAEAITQDERFATWHIWRGEDEAFLKRARSEKSRRRLVNELWGNRTLARLAADDSEAPFRIPQIISHDEKQGWMMAQFVSGMSLSPGDYERSTVMAAEPTMLKLYAYLDQAIVPESSYSPARFGSSHNADQLDEKIRDKFESIGQALSRFEDGLIKNALEFIHSHYSNMTPAFAHGDLTPKHVMGDGSGKPFIIDFESCSLYWPRFYEPINLATKLNIVHGLADESDAFMDKFFEAVKQDPAQHDTALKTVSLVRTLLIIHELVAKPSNQRIYHTELKPEHQSRVEMMIKRCLTDQPLF